MTLLAEVDATLVALTEALRAQQKQERLAKAERRLAVALRRMFKAQEDIYLPRILDALRGVLQEATPKVPIDWDRLFDDVQTGTSEQFLREWVATGDDALTAGQQAVLAELDFGLSFNLPYPAAEAFLTTHGAKLVTRVNSATKQKLRQTLANGLAAGQGVDELAKSIRAMGRSFRVPKPQRHIRDRAELIAATELAFAYETAGWNTARGLRSSGFDLQKRWLPVNDDRVDPLCAAYAREGEDGYVDGEHLYGGRVQHPPAHPACRCALTWRWPDTAQKQARTEATADDEGYVPAATVRKWRTFKDVQRPGLGERVPGFTGKDQVLATILSRQGFGALPHVVTKAQAAAYEAAGEVRWYRGVGGTSFTGAFRSGELYVGGGIWGNGTYIAAGPRGFAPTPGSMTGQLAPGLGREAVEVAQEFAGYGGKLMTGTIRKGAKIVEWDDLEAEWHKAIAEYGEQVDSPAGREAATTGEQVLTGMGKPWSGLGGLPEVLQDPGRYAAAQGYDIIYVPRSNRVSSKEAGDQYVVLNRSALRVEEEDFEP